MNTVSSPMPQDDHLDAEIGRFLAHRAGDLRAMPTTEDAIAALSVRLGETPRRLPEGTARSIGRTVAQPRTRRSHVMFTAARLVAAVAVIALGTGALFLQAGGRPSFPATSPTPSASRSPQLSASGPYLPAELPADLPGGTIDTPLGPALWVHLSGDATTLPGGLWPMADAAGGLLWFEGGSYWGGGGGPDWGWEPALWASEDAVSPRYQIALPVSARDAHLDVAGGAFWLATDDPPSLWRSVDARTWEPVDLSGLASPGPRELEWRVDLGTPASSGERTVIPVSYWAEDVGRLLGRPDLGRSVRPKRVSPGVYRVMQTTGTPRGDLDTGTTVHVEETDTGLRFSDEAGATVAELDEVGIELVHTWAEDGSIVEHGVGVIEAGRATAAELPGPAPKDFWIESALLGTETGFVSFHSEPDGTVRAWRSSDGRAWTEGPRIGAREGEPQQVENLYSVSGRTPAVVASTAYAIPNERAWETTDGISWTAVPRVPGSAYGSSRLLTAGWLSLDGDSGLARVSVDGETWERAPGIESVITKWTTAGAGIGGGTMIVGDTLFWGVAESEGAGRRDLWVIEIDPAAGANGTPGAAGLNATADP